MAGPFRIKITGQISVMRTLNQYQRDLPTEVGKELTAEHEEIMLVAKDRTPVDTGNLRATGHVEPAVVQRNRVVSRGGFGGPAIPYAAIVHEDLSKRHRIGQAKYYESAVIDALPGIANRIANGVYRRNPSWR